MCSNEVVALVRTSKHRVFMVQLLLGYSLNLKTWASGVLQHTHTHTHKYQEGARDPTWSCYDTVISRVDVPGSEEKLIILYSVIRCDLQRSCRLHACGKRPFGLSSTPRAAATKLVGGRVSEWPGLVKRMHSDSANHTWTSGTDSRQTIW
jgi:hypothetical protein